MEDRKNDVSEESASSFATCENSSSRHDVLPRKGTRGKTNLRKMASQDDKEAGFPDSAVQSSSEAAARQVAPDPIDSSSESSLIETLRMLWRVLSGLPHDSFTSLTSSSDEELPYISSLFTMTSQQRLHQAVFRSPAFSHLHVHPSSEWCIDETTAKREAGLRCLAELSSDNLMEDLDPKLAAAVKAHAVPRPPCSPPAANASGRQIRAQTVSELKNSDLGNPAQPWPEDLRVLRIELQSNVQDSMRFGLLMDSSSADFGLALSARHICSKEEDVAFFVPVTGAWPSTGSPDQPEDLIRRYHELACYAMLPQLRPKFCGIGSFDFIETDSESDGADAEGMFSRLPAGALLVQLDARGQQISWKAMIPPPYDRLFCRSTNWL